MFDCETVEIIIWGILGIAGLLLAVSRLRLGKKLDWRIGLGIPLFGVSLFVLTTTLPRYGVGFSIIGTLILAGAALMAIKQSDNQVRSDRRERKLITIITWANDIAKCETEVPLTPLPIEELVKSASKLGKEKVDAIIEYHNRIPKVNLIMRYQALDAMGTQIVLIAKGLDKQLGSKLEGLAQQTADKLTKHTKLGFKFVAGEITDKQYKTHWKSLVKRAMALAEKAAEITD